MFKSLAIVSFALCSSAVSAEVLPVEYKSFYSHLRKIDKDDMQALQFAFGFKQVNQTTLCHINQASIQTQKKSIELTISKENRFVLPTEKALKLADALVLVDLQQASNQCDMSVQLETKSEYLKTSYSQEELLELLTQYKTFFDSMGSFLSFLMPSVAGLVIHFEQEVPSSLSKYAFRDKSIQLSQEQIMNLDTLTLVNSPIRIISYNE